jgi:hypothetical protein
MNTVLEIYDERRPGAECELCHRLELPVERMTARDLIRCRIEAEAGTHGRFRAPLAPDARYSVTRLPIG